MLAATSQGPALRVSKLYASYSGLPGGDALRGLSLELKPGSILALLGSNGAGKTTLLRCLTGLLPPVSGSVEVLDTEVANEFPPRLLSRMGVLLESPGGYARMTVEEYLRFFASFYPVPIPPGRIQELAKVFEFQDLSERIDKLSQGNRRKVQLIRSLLHRPRLVLWDEPTEHLDPGTQRRALAHLREYVATGASALITSHRLEQMEEWADSFAFIKRGMVVHHGTRSDLHAGGDDAEIEGLETLKEAALISLHAIAAKHGLECAALSPAELRLGQWGFHLRGPKAVEALPEFIESAVLAGGRVIRAAPRRRSLESLYRRHVEGE